MKIPMNLRASTHSKETNRMILYGEYLKLGYFFYIRFHDKAVICCFRNDTVGGYSLLKFDFETGIRWILNFAKTDEAIRIMKVFCHMGNWHYSPKSAYWRNMPPSLALIFNSRGVDASQIDDKVFTTMITGKITP